MRTAEQFYEAFKTATEPFDSDRLYSALPGSDERRTFRAILDQLDGVAEVRTYPTLLAFLKPTTAGYYNRFADRRLIFVRSRTLIGRQTLEDQIDTICHEALHLFGEEEFLNRHSRCPPDAPNAISVAEHCVVHEAARHVAGRLGLFTLVKFNESHRDHYARRLMRLVPNDAHRSLFERLSALAGNAVQHITGQEARPQITIAQLLGQHGVTLP